MVCVTHRVGYVEQHCDLVVVLALDGVLAFVGPPAEALSYFDIPQLGLVYQRLRERPRPTGSSGSATARSTSNTWPSGSCRNRRPSPSRRHRREAPSPPARDWPSGGNGVCWSRRYAAIQWADKRALAVMFGQSLLIAGLLVWLFGDITQPEVLPEAKHLAAASRRAWAGPNCCRRRTRSSSARPGRPSARSSPPSCCSCCASRAFGSAATTPPRRSSRNARSSRRNATWVCRSGATTARSCSCWAC